jgi:hypothetical protein
MNEHVNEYAAKAQAAIAGAEAAPGAASEAAADHATYMRRRTILFVIIAAVVIAMVFYFVNNGANDDGDASVLKKLEQIMILPAGEAPTISTVTNAEGLRNESSFYRNVANGDKILIYQGASKIIIFRDEKNLIVNVGPIMDS